MELEQIILTNSATCDCCQKIIAAGDPVFPLFDTDDKYAESHNIPLGEIRSTWILSFCSECVKTVNNENMAISDNRAL